MRDKICIWSWVLTGTIRVRECPLKQPALVALSRLSRVCKAQEPKSVLARSSVSLHINLDSVVQRGGCADARGCEAGVHPVQLVPMRRRGEHRAGVAPQEFDVIDGPEVSGADS